MSRSRARERLSSWTRWESVGAILLVALVLVGLASGAYNHQVGGRTMGWLLCALMGGWAVCSWALGRATVRQPRSALAVLSCFGFVALWSGLYLLPLPTAFVMDWSPVWRETMELLRATMGPDALPASLPLATAPEAARIAFDQAVAMLLVVPAALILASRERGAWLLAGIVVGLSVLEGCLGLFISTIGDSTRSHGVHLNSNHHAASILMGLPLLATWMQRRGGSSENSVGQGYVDGRGHRDQQIFLYCLTAATLTGWLLASSRGSLAAAAVAFSVWGGIELRDHWLNARRSRVPSGSRALARFSFPIGIMAIVGIAALVMVSPIFQARLADTDEADSRFAYWKATLKGLQEEPVLGLGPGGANFSINRFLDGFATDLAPTWSHNDYVQIVAEFGLAGSLILAVLVALALVMTARDAALLGGAGRRQRALWRAMVAGLATVFLHSFTDFHLRSPLFMIQTICLLSLIVTHGQTYLVEKSGSEIGLKSDSHPDE